MFEITFFSRVTPLSLPVPSSNKGVRLESLGKKSYRCAHPGGTCGSGGRQICTKLSPTILPQTGFGRGPETPVLRNTVIGSSHGRSGRMLRMVVGDSAGSSVSGDAFFQPTPSFSTSPRILPVPIYRLLRKFTNSSKSSTISSYPPSVSIFI
eukprot:2944304-Rhodomonas_salina.1